MWRMLRSLELQRHQRQADVRSRGLLQQIRARHHADIFNQGTPRRTCIAADKLSYVAGRAWGFVAGYAKPDPTRHSSHRESDRFW